MGDLPKGFQGAMQCDVRGVAKSRPLAAVPWTLFVVSFALLAIPSRSFAESKTGVSSAAASVQIRIVIPAVIRVTVVTQPKRFFIEERHVAQGYIDVEGATSVKLTSNNRDGYQLNASYDSQLLSSIEVRISSQQLNATIGSGSMRVRSGLATNKLVPIDYRFHLVPQVRSGDYRWPVALVFSLVPV